MRISSYSSCGDAIWTSLLCVCAQNNMEKRIKCRSAVGIVFAFIYVLALHSHYTHAKSQEAQRKGKQERYTYSVKPGQRAPASTLDRNGVCIRAQCPLQYNISDATDYSLHFARTNTRTSAPTNVARINPTAEYDKFYLRAMKNCANIALNSWPQREAGKVKCKTFTITCVMAFN